MITPAQTSEFDVVVMPTNTQQRKIDLVIVSSVALSFISFWRAAAIVLNDMASTVYYIGGISEQAIGKAAPWFVLGVMLFAYAVRAVYVESCTMFTRGGVYRVVKEAMGGPLAKLSVSALMFDYVLTGPISAVSAGQYLVGMFGNLIAFGHTLMAMSGEESLAQVYREIEAPKVPNLLKAGAVIALYSLVLTGVVTFLAVMIIPDAERIKTIVDPSTGAIVRESAKYTDNLISGL